MVRVWTRSRLTYVKTKPTKEYRLRCTHQLKSACMPTNHQIGLIALIKRSRPINLITGPIIYSMVLPIMLLDLCVSFYQWTCFPIYGIAKFNRKDFIIFDRQELKYLDWVSKFHCTYCAYGVGVAAYVQEIIKATEAYFCPVKHKEKNLIATQKHWQALAFEQGPDFDFEAYLEKVRNQMTQKDEP